MTAVELAAIVVFALAVIAVVWIQQRERSTESDAGLRSFPNVAALTAATGRGDFELVWLRGYYFDGDGGQGWLAFSPTSAPPPDDGMVFAAVGGRWVRYWDGVTMYANWWGCRHDGNGQGHATDDQPRLQAALDWSPDCYTVQLGRGIYAIGATLTIPVGKTLQGQAGGDAGMQQELLGKASVLEYQGPSSDALTACIVALSSGSILRRLSIHPAVTVHLTAGVGLSNPVNTTTALVEDVGVEGNAGHWLAPCGYLDHCLMIGAGSQAQDDNLEWNRGFMNNAHRSAVAWSGGQPYNTVFNHVRFDNMLGIGGFINNAFGYTGKAAAGSYGTVFEYRGEAQSFGSLTVNGGEIEYYATLLKGFSSMTTYIQIRNMEWEGVRRLWIQGNYGKSWLPVTFLGGRYSTAGTETTVYGPDGQTVEIAPEDQNLIYDRSGVVFTMIGVDMGAGGPSEREEGWKFALDPHCTLNAIGCAFPNRDMVLRMNLNANPNIVGGTYIQGCRGFSAQVPEGNCGQYEDRLGAENADGFVTLRDETSSVLVKLPKPEWGRGVYDGASASYAGDGVEPVIQIEAFATRSSPGCAVGAFRARVLPHFSQIYLPVEEFDLVLDAPPGAGEFVTYSFRLSQNRQFS